MDSDSPLVGALCGHVDCDTHDFLPTKCPGCAKLFCSIHYFPDVHACNGPEVAAQAVVERAPVLSCCLEGCRTPCLESYAAQDTGREARIPAACPHCLRSFCPQHRFPDTHRCEGSIPNAAPQNEAARAVLAKNFPLHDMEKKNVARREPELNAKTRQRSKGSELVQMMKMRQTAVPGEPTAGHVDVQNRLHVKVRVDNPSRYKIFWFRKSISTGRALDLLQERLGISSNKTWAVLEDSEDTTELSTAITGFDRPLSELLTDGCRLTPLHS